MEEHIAFQIAFRLAFPCHFIIHISSGGRAALVKHLRRHHDSTPMLFKFGSMQSSIAHTARYLKKLPPDREGGYTRWTTCSYAEFKRSNPRIAPQSGVLEVFGQTSRMSTCCYEADLDVTSQLWAASLDVKSQDFVFPATVLSNANSSCVFDALSDTYANFTIDNIKSLAEQSEVMGLEEIPDGSRANRRQKSFMVKAFEDCDNIMVEEHGSCSVHKLHNAVTKSIGETDFVTQCQRPPPQKSSCPGM